MACLTWEKMALEAAVVWKDDLYIANPMDSTDKC